MAKRAGLFNLINSTKKEEHDYAQEFLNDYIFSVEQKDKLNKRAISKTIKPSSLNSCHRGIVYQLLGEEQDEDSGKSSALIHICESGSSRHESIQADVLAMKQMGIDCEYVSVADYIKEHSLPIEVKKASNFEKGDFESKLKSFEYEMSFLCDGLIKYKGKYFIFEIKTETSRQFFPRKDVSDKHKLQTTAYALTLGIDDVMVLYENRDICSKKVFIYTPTKEEKEDLKEFMLACIDYRNKKTIPAKPADACNKMCVYCNYKKLCSSDGAGEVKREKEK